MSLWDKIDNALNQKAAQLVYAAIPQPGSAPLVAEEGYFRVSITDMFLTDAKKWGTSWHPAVHGEVRIARAGYQPEVMTRVASPPSEALAQGVFKQFHVTPLVPFRGGVVSIQASLLALKGESYLGVALKIVDAIASITGAALGPASAVATELITGVERLFDTANGNVHLGLHDEYTSDGDGAQNPLRAGYRAVILADRGKFRQQDLSIVDRTLHYVRNPGEAPSPLTGHDYVLFHIETRQTRDDWRIPSIEEPLMKAREALLRGETVSAQVYERMAVTEAWTTPTLIEVDRTRVVKALREALEKLKEPGHGLAPAAKLDLEEVMKSAPGVKEAKALPVMSLQQALS